MVNRANVTILIPISYEGEALKTTFPAVLNALSALCIVSEVILIGGPSHEETNRVAIELAKVERVRFFEVKDSAKFEKLCAGVAIANGNILIIMDADTLPAPFTLVRLLKPILEDEADVCAGHPLAVNVHDAESPLCKVLAIWGETSMQIWNLVRKENLFSRWALPGYLFALRKEFFPTKALVPVLDDASIGLFAMEKGARFAYEERAVVGVLTPNSYTDWIRQKLRIRGGWELLGRLKRDECEKLSAAISTAKKKVLGNSSTLNILLYAHDKFLRIYASIFLCSYENALKSSWRPVMSTKNWDKNKQQIFFDSLSLTEL